MNIKNWIAGLFALLGVPTAMVFGNVGFAVFIDLPSVVLVLIIVPGLGLFSHGFSGLAQAYRTAIGNGTREELARAEVVFKGLKQTLFHTGLFCMVLGLVSMLSNTADTGSIVRGLAMTMLALLYALFLNLYCLQPFLVRVQEFRAVLQTKHE